MRFSRLALPLTSLIVLAAACSSSSSDSPLSHPTETDNSSSSSSSSSTSSTSGSASSSSGTPGDDDDASVDAGTDANAPVDAGLDAGDPDCAGLQYCDDFESYTAGAVADGSKLGPWVASLTTDATMEINATKGFNGTKALHITVTKTSASGTHGLLNQNNAAGLVPGDNLFGRAMVFYADTNGAGLPLTVHSWLFMGWGDITRDNAAANINIGGGGAAVQLNYHFASPPAPTGQEASKTGGTVTAAAWHCLQWEYDGSGNPAADHTVAYLDGTKVIDVAKTVGWTLPTWKSMDFGFLHYQATLPNSVDVYLDDFAVDKTMPACPAKQ